MYFWNISALAEDLKNEKVSQKDKMKYFLVISLDLFRINNTTFEIGIIGNIYPFIEMIVIAIGVLLCYKVNRLGDNKEFVDRMVCLSWPISCRINVLRVILLCIIDPKLFYPDSKLTSDLSFFFLHLILLFAYFIFLRSYILDISGANRKNDTVAPPTA